MAAVLWVRRKKRVGMSTEAALRLLTIRSTAGCRGRALSLCQGPSRSAEVGCPANLTLHILLLHRSKREVTAQGPGRCAFLFKQMLLFWTPDFAINFGLFFAICLSQSGFSSPGKLSPCDFINPVLPLLSAAGSPLGLQLEFCSPPLAWLEQLLAYLSPQSHY